MIANHICISLIKKSNVRKCTCTDTILENNVYPSLSGTKYLCYFDLYRIDGKYGCSNVTDRTNDIIKPYSLQVDSLPTEPPGEPIIKPKNF